MRVSVGTPLPWYVKTEWMRWRDQFITQLAAVAKVQVINSEGSIIDRNWSNVIGQARTWAPDWFVLLESDVTIPWHGQELLRYLEKCPYDAVMSPGGGVTGYMYRLKGDQERGSRMLQDFSFWQNVRSTGARIWADPSLPSKHWHAYGGFDSLPPGPAIECYEGWMGLAVIRGWVLQSLKVLFRLADCDYYCAQNDFRE